MALAFIIIITGLLYLFYIVDTLSIPLFLILKLCGVITWSWLMVYLPLIIWSSALLITFILTGILAYIGVENN